MTIFDALAMRITALSLLLLFTSFTVVLSTYYLWDGEDQVLTIMPVEEEEDHQIKRFGPETHLLSSLHKVLEIEIFFENKEIIYPSEENAYEDVHLIIPYSPPDVLMIA